MGYAEQGAWLGEAREKYQELPERREMLANFLQSDICGNCDSEFDEARWKYQELPEGQGKCCSMCWEVTCVKIV